MYKYIDLKSKNVQWLVTEAQKYKLTVYSGKNLKKKEELINSIMNYENRREVSRSKMKAEEGMEGKYAYISTVPLGTLVAFESSNRAMTGKIIKRVNEDEEMEVQTAYGKVFAIKFNQIIWVKTGSRWPRGVYELLKSTKDNKKNK